jgi:hypothetical protein
MDFSLLKAHHDIYYVQNVYIIGLDMGTPV